MDSITRLKHARVLAKEATAFLGDATRILKGPGSVMSKFMRYRPLIAEGMDHLPIQGAAKTLGNLAPDTVRGIASSPASKFNPFTQGTRNQMAQYLRSSRRNMGVFTNAAMPDIERFGGVQNEMRGFQQRGQWPPMSLMQEGENIKNRYGGMSPVDAFKRWI